MGSIRLFVNDLQIGEFGEGRTRLAACALSGIRIWNTLIDIAKSQQVIAVIADVANIQRQVAAEGVLHAEVVIHDVGGLEMWIHRIEGARRGVRAREPGLRKNNALPVEGWGQERGLGEIDRAAKVPRRRTCALTRLAGSAGRVFGDVAQRVVRGPVVHERPRKERRVDDTGSAADHSGPLARDIPGKTHAGREVFAVGLPESRAYAWLALLNNSILGIRIEVPQEVVDLSDRP